MYLAFSSGEHVQVHTVQLVQTRKKEAVCYIVGKFVTDHENCKQMQTSGNEDIGPQRPEGGGTVRSRGGKLSVEELPDGPVDEEVQNQLLEQFRKAQESQELWFSSLLVIVSLPLFVFFVVHAYLHLIDPWSWPFRGLKDADQTGRRAASVAHIFTGLALVLSFASSLAQQKMRGIRKPVLATACVLATLAGVCWLRILLSLPAFPWEYAGFFAGVLLLPILLQWYVMRIWEGTRTEIQRLEGLKYRCQTA